MKQTLKEFLTNITPDVFQRISESKKNNDIKNEDFEIENAIKLAKENNVQGILK